MQETLSHLLAGSIAGACGIAAGQPFDTVKVRLQTQPGGAERLYSGPINCAAQVFRKEGFRALFKGMTAPIVANAPINAVLFAVEHHSLQYLNTSRYTQDIYIDLRHFIAGCISGLSQCLLACPAELIKIHLQVKQERIGAASVSTFGVFRQIFDSQGIKGLYRGLPVTVLRDTPAFGVYFYVYEKMKQLFSRRRELSKLKQDKKVDNLTPDEIDHIWHYSGEYGPRGIWWRQQLEELDGLENDWTHAHDVDNRTEFHVASNASNTEETANKHDSDTDMELGALELMMAGGIAGSTSWMVLHPIDVMKTLIQSTPANESHRFMDVFRRKYARYGYSFLFRGLVPTCIRGFPASAVLFLTYEWALKAAQDIIPGARGVENLDEPGTAAAADRL